MYFLDTNTCIYFLNGRYEKVKDTILSTPPNRIKIPSIVKAELVFGAYKSRKRVETLEKVEKFLGPYEVAAFGDQMAYTYAEIRATGESKGIIIGPNDLLIAAIVKFHEGTLVTNNVHEFERIPGLKVENWAE